MRVLIIEQMYDGGHYLNYVRHLVQAFAPLGCEIVVAVPNPALGIGTIQNVSLASSTAFSVGIYSTSR